MWALYRLSGGKSPQTNFKPNASEELVIIQLPFYAVN